MNTDRNGLAAEALAFKQEWRSQTAMLADKQPTIEEQRLAFDREHAAIAPAPGCAIEPIATGSIRVEKIVPSNADTRKALLYHHGGGHAFGSSTSHRHLVSRIAHAAGIIAFNMDYPLAPERPFPAGLETALANYRHVREQGIDPANIVVAGESAGGNLTAALLLLLKQQQTPLPAAAYMLSPWLDLTQSGVSYSERAGVDPMVSREIMEQLAENYAPSGRDNPLISPLFGDLGNLPPILIQVGTDEVLLSDSVRFAERVALEGGNVRLDCWAGIVHAWPLFEHRMPKSAAAAIAAAGAWIRQVLG